MKLIMGFGLSFALLIHLAAGHSAAYIAKDFSGGIILLVGGTAAIFCFRLARQVAKVPISIWQKNRRAAILAKKVNGLKELTESEQNEVDHLIKEGILSPMPYVYKNEWRKYVQLSEGTMKQTFHY